MAINLKGIVSISGEQGLFKSITVTPQGLLVETINEYKRRTIKPIQRHEISTLDDIGIYVTSNEDTLPVAVVLEKMHTALEGSIDLKLHDTPAKRASFMKKIVPAYDPSRVHDTSIKKILQWYHILVSYTPDLFKALA